MERLKAIYDLERIVSRLEVGSANARDLVSLRTSLAVLPEVKAVLANCKSRKLQRIYNNLHVHEDIYAALEAAIVDEPPFSVREGGMIISGYNAELDELHMIAKDNKSWMQNF